MKRAVFIAVTVACCFAMGASAVDVSGDHEAPNKEFSKDANYRLVGDTTFGWKTVSISGDIDLNGHSFLMKTGGGNQTIISGSISGTGTVEWQGGGIPQKRPSLLSGEKPNTFHGLFMLARGVLDLDKPSGVDAIPGDMIIGTKGDAIVRLIKSNQINDAARLAFRGKGVNGLELKGNREVIAALTMESHAIIDMGDKPSTLMVGDSSGCPWDLSKTITVFRFKPGQDRLAFGHDNKGLRPSQLARIGFDTPAGMPDGLYTARIESDGQLVPDTLVNAVSPPFDLSSKARAERTKVYDVPGLAYLTGKESPLKEGMTIVFFGDSITWQNGYIGAIDKAIKTGVGTQGKAIKLINRGINGGGVRELRDGAGKNGYPGNTPQRPFAEVIAVEKADVAVVFIGINDVWHLKTPPDVFEQGLRDLVASAKSNKTTLVVATMTVHGERPDGENGDDPKIEQYCEITRKVAESTGATLADLRRAYIAYLLNQNVQLRVDGTLSFKPSGVLTYDGVHPTAIGNELLATLIGDGLFRAIRK